MAHSYSYENQNLSLASKIVVKLPVADQIRKHNGRALVFCYLCSRDEDTDHIFSLVALQPYCGAAPGRGWVLIVLLDPFLNYCCSSTLWWSVETFILVWFRRCQLGSLDDKD